MSVRHWVAAALLAFACASSSAHDEQSIRAATQRYANLIAAMDNAGIAAMYAPDGEVDIPGRQPVRGPVAIEHFLEGFRDFHVLSEVMTTDRVNVDGSTAQSAGTYRQRVRLPGGKVVEVHGTYGIVWRRGPSPGAWQIEKIATTPER